MTTTTAMVVGLLHMGRCAKFAGLEITRLENYAQFPGPEIPGRALFIPAFLRE